MLISIKSGQGESRELGAMDKEYKAIDYDGIKGKREDKKKLKLQ